MTTRAQYPQDRPPDGKVDEEVWETFPASDPPSSMTPGQPEAPPNDE